MDSLDDDLIHRTHDSFDGTDLLIARHQVLLMMTDELYFDGQRDGERIIALWRRNPATTLPQGFFVIGESLLVVAALRFYGASLVTSITLGVWLLLAPYTIFLTWFRWWNDLYILTNQRLVDVNQAHFFHRSVAEVPLENIQDVSFETHGLGQMILNFGTVKVQTASVITEIDVVGVTDPQAVAQTILRTVQLVKRDHRRDRSTVKDSDANQESVSAGVRTQLG
ncbi:PH domain-containing protein [Candidatus Berkelbacteria bacterium]|nr:PH domain-containing protein [Candidatus Berkelbacteria bacterium]